jgi:cell division protein FtsQ
MSVGRVRKNYHGVGFSWKLMLKALVFALFVATLSISVNKFKTNQYFPIKDVKIFGVNHANHQVIQEIVTPWVNKGFFRVDVERIREQIASLPWVSAVVVRREWPSMVVVRLAEKQAVALWNQKTLLSSGGELFTPESTTYPQDLPQLTGPEGEQLMVERYYTQMSNILMPLHFKISQLELTPAMTWAITLDNGIKLSVGHKDVLTRLNHFVKVYSKIVGNRVADVDYIDLRYTNGLAVRWKSVT